MIRTVALLGLVASTSAIFGFFEGEPWEEGFFYKFDANFLMWGKTSFLPLPLNCSAAKEQGWTMMTDRPTRSSGYDALTLWVHLTNPVVGILVDENERTAGLQVSIPCDGLTAHFDMKEQGFTLWIFTNADGKIEKRWIICLYFVSEDKETRIAYNETRLLQEKYVAGDGINGELFKVATYLNDIDSIWKEQACVPLMGRHYYYNMTTTLGCDKPFFPWFPLFDCKTKQLTGMGFMSVGSLKTMNNEETKFETPSTSVVKYIVPTCPTCMLDLVENYGALTMHFYFVNEPTKINCFNC